MTATVTMYFSSVRVAQKALNLFQLVLGGGVKAGTSTSRKLES